MNWDKKSRRMRAVRADRWVGGWQNEQVGDFSE